MSTLAESRKIAGFVIDGPIRDFDALSKGNFPVFARSVSHRGPYKEGPGEINVTVCVDGMVVHPGDIIVGDQDGLFAIRPEIADELAKLVADIEKKEKEIFVKIAKGTLDRSWVDQALRAKGVLK
jgi:regulator of RNase E activity RraA